MTTINIPNAYPVELSPPDLSTYAKGSDGVPYIWTFDSGAPGPHAMVSAIVHGNELSGAIAVDWLLNQDVRPSAGKLSFAFMNIAAYAAFDPGDPNATRWVDEDFNRVWDVAVLDGERDSVELRRAREVRPVLDTVDFLFDIHTMQHLAPPLMMSGRHAKSKALAARIGVPERVVGDHGHAAGRRMRDYQEFDDPASPKTALLIECGQHWEAASEDLAKLSAVRFLEVVGMVPQGSIAVGGLPEARQRFFTVVEAVTIESDSFSFAREFTGGEIITEAGTLLGHDGDRPVVTPADNIMLVMPSMRLWKGQTAVRLAREDD
ncbi:M14 family metallopeptidase [Ovoidimarina sediminis]|uniref:succinylglutamate desuccinylase/aspartoacylase domain-containing protein n=1 Tax=Ovoidimarina sediminis TaxID=3079856 RepID=UPI00291294AF|nr:succinylglutamate desuccinylase/aspartoacylase family protein [Rhodophyticola sp. MJ-SS7]MDU8942081.1 succinylglutamate desuccinylase/aspartoacylase family protein [Rhodophyticola sp. MJ-SS7]